MKYIMINAKETKQRQHKNYCTIKSCFGRQELNISRQYFQQSNTE